MEEYKNLKTLGYCAGAGIGLVVSIIAIVIMDAVMNAKYGTFYEKGFGAGDFILLLFITVVCCLIFGPFIYKALVEKFHGEEIRAENERLDKLISYFQGALTIKSRDPGFKNRISLQSIKNVNYKYNDPQLVYTGVTVGGVTTGGFHVEGGDYTKTVSDSGKFRLMYNEVLPYEKILVKIDRPIKEIYLTQQLLEEAEKDPFISQFLDAGVLKLTYIGRRDKAWSDSAVYAASTGNVELLLHSNQQADLGTYLSQNDCIYISQWLCGDK